MKLIQINYSSEEFDVDAFNADVLECPNCGEFAAIYGMIPCPDKRPGCLVAHYGYKCLNCISVFKGEDEESDRGGLQTYIDPDAEAEVMRMLDEAITKDMEDNIKQNCKNYYGESVADPDDVYDDDVSETYFDPSDENELIEAMVKEIIPVDFKDGKIIS